MDRDQTSYDRPKPTVGAMVSFRLAAKVVQFRPNNFVEVIDEDGLTHEIPVFACQSANDSAVERFNRKEQKRLNPNMTVRPERGAAPVDQVADVEGRLRGGLPRASRDRDDRRDRIERRQQKERGY